MFGKKKDKKKKQKPEIFVSLTANGVPAEAFNVSLKKDEDGSPLMVIYTRDVCEALHYSHVDFELKTNLKLLRLSANFKEAKNEKKFKVYIFNVDGVSQFYI
ncbi:MAG: hypothetical protein IJT27_09710 [Clostridia bacterium]|nr:hypothetical protein [Clostridia bacterium]